MKEIRVKLENIYKVYSDLVKDNNLIFAEKNLIELFNHEKDSSRITSELYLKVENENLRNVLIKEILRKNLIKESTLSTSTIEGEIVDEKTFEQASININSIEGEKRKTYSSILSLYDVLETYVLPNEIKSDDLKHLHKKIFNNKKMNPGFFKASENFVLINKETKLIYVAPNEVDIEIKNICDFINDKDSDSNPIIKASLIHMYLALTHPFLDGNGRVIRILFNKYLSKILGRDIYIDSVILENLDLYKENLNKFRDGIEGKKNFINYVNILLTKYKMDEDNKMKSLYSKYFRINNSISKIKGIPSTKVNELSLFITKNKFLTIRLIESELNVSRITANKYAELLVENNLLTLEVNNKRKIYFFKK